jgi:hypothetical protein
MEDNILRFGKELFVSFKQENINQYYEVIAKVNLKSGRNSEKEPLEPSTRAGSEEPKDPGEPSKKYRSHKSRTSTCSRTKSKSRWDSTTPT